MTTSVVYMYTTSVGGFGMKLTDAEWAVMEVLWEGEKFSLKEVTDKLFSPFTISC